MIRLLLYVTLFLDPVDPQLNEEAWDICPCQIRGKETQEIVDQMFEIGCEEGFSAPQIGIQKSIILVNLAPVGAEPKLKEFINPQIVWKSEEQTIGQEGCISTGHIHGIVPRAEKVSIRSYDRKCQLSVQEFSGHIARIFQHEIDHLDGIRFPDRIENDNDLHWVEPDEIPSYQTHWLGWKKKAPREVWLKMKNQ